MNTKARNVLIAILFSIVFLAVIGYIYHNSKNFISGPRVEITEPINGSSFSDPVIKIKGMAENISYIKINGKQIFVDENQIFENKYILSEGRNFITILAEDRFGKTEKKILDLILLENK